ncbi:MAG: MBL fold metallo-hydrolase [Patescibacteria group bacterium]
MGGKLLSGFGWRRSVFLVTLVGCMLLLFWILPGSWNWWATRGADFTVHFFDVGQGDSAFVQCRRTQAVIDGGPSRAVLQKVGRAMPFTDRRIEYVFLTHPHDDHFFGLFDLLERYEIGHLVITEYTAEQEVGRELIALAERHNIKVLLAEAGDTMQLGGCGEFEVLWPDQRSQPVAENGRDYDNDLSLMLELRSAVGAPLALFTGDIGVEVEYALLDDDALHRTPIMKVPHHGSRYSSSSDFVQAVRPEFAIFPVGENRFGHPSETTLLRYEKLQTKIRRSDFDGDTVFAVSPSDIVELISD